MTDGHGEAALVLGGGGARAAYQVGVLRAVARRVPDLRFPILTGVSAGAVNTAILANHVGPFGDAVGSLTSLWNRLTISEVFRTTPLSLLKRTLRTAAQLTTGVRPGDDIVEGMVDTSPLRKFLERWLPAPGGSLPGVAENLKSERLRAVAVTATRYASGESVTFCAGREVRPWRRPQRSAVATKLTLDHVMASSALPFVYPAVAVEGVWYGDGEIGPSAPLSPALHLGAGRIVVITTWDVRGAARSTEPAGHPAPRDVMNALYGAIFTGNLDRDVAEFERVNQLLRGRARDESLGLRTASLLVVRPSVDLGAVVSEPEIAVPRSLRFLARRLDLRQGRSRDLMSILMLDQDFIRRMIEIGEGDGERRADEIAAFLEG